MRWGWGNRNRCYMYVHTHLCTYVHMYSPTVLSYMHSVGEFAVGICNLCMHVCMCIRMYVCTYVRTYVRVCTYVHTMFCSILCLCTSNDGHWLPLQVDADSRTILAGFGDGVVRVLVMEESDPSQVSAGKRLAPTLTLAHVCKPHSNAVVALAVDPRGELLATGVGGTRAGNYVHICAYVYSVTFVRTYVCTYSI